ncbi:MAG TPA: hypothetical protein PKK06_04895 [Phycisphaerae bacterium]|nr:hypothetical protein [Phycisphaerae bacterium]HNU45177.1 hypothetical protein [Phycisphaerae bacterium]
MSWLPCPHLKRDVELTAEREQHITQRHPDLLPEYRRQVAETVAAPDQVRRSARFANARLLSRWYTEVKAGKHVVVVAASEPDSPGRPWIITAHLTSHLPGGLLEWKRS